jgi:putative ABC transport system substrate-binding protein
VDRLNTRRKLVIALGAAAIAPRNVFAQQRIARIGILSNNDRESSGTFPHMIKHLAALGYVEGKNLTIEYRNGGSKAEQTVAQVREMLNLNLDLIMTTGPALPVRALITEKAILPVVFLAIDYDPVDSGFVANYNRPGGNLTGVYVAQPALAIKRFELVREIVPASKRFLVLHDIFCKDQFAAVREVAAKAAMQLEPFEFKTRPYDYTAAFAQGRLAGAQAMIGMMSPQFFFDRAKIAALAVQNRLPAVGGANPFAEAGFLASYGAPLKKVTERSVEIAVRILKGTKPGNIPVEQIDVFEFAINMKTAKALGIKIPNSILVRADKVID